MNTIQCIVLLACIICTSETIPSCRCVKTSKAVKPSLIADVEVYDPRPYCNKKEVIVTLKDKELRCLDPNEKFTQAVVKTILMQRALRAEKKNTSTSQTTTASATVTPTSATVTPTSATVTPTSATVTPTSATVTPTSSIHPSIFNRLFH